MKKYLALMLLIAMLALTLTACTDDFVFIDKSNDNKNEQNDNSNTTDNNNNSSGEENNQSGGENNGGNGGDTSSGGDRYPGWGSPIPLD